MPLRVLFLDMNSYFASVEQHLRPELRGHPVVVAALDVDSTCCIAASYEAKRLGLRTGTPVWQARLHKEVRVIEARPEMYVRVHHKIIKAVETCIPVHGVHSIDEMSCLLDARQIDPDAALALAQRVKCAIYNHVGPCLKCSIGLAPNRLLAKVAADMQKPDGLVVLNDSDLPRALHPLHLNDLPGIGSRMLLRLATAGITTVEELCGLSELQLKNIWGGVVGQRWWYWLRGFNVPEAPTRRSSVCHSHVLPPELRTREGARAVLIRLIHKVAARLRRLNHCASLLEVYISFTFREEGWKAAIPLQQCQDTLSMLEAFNILWQSPPPGDHPTQVAVTLYKLTNPRSTTLSLFPADQHRLALSYALDSLNDRFGGDTVYFADMHGMQEVAPTRIGFTQIPDFPVDDL